MPLSAVHLSCQPLPLPLETPFRTAHGESRERTNALVTLTGPDGQPYFGEGALPPYYPHSVEDIRHYVEALGNADARLGGPPFALHKQLTGLPSEPAPARCAVDLALHDRWAKHFSCPLHELLGLDPADAPPSSITLSLTDDEGALREQVRAHRSASVLKLKLGGDTLEEDERAVRIVQEETNAALGVDANEAWSIDEAAAIIPRLPEDLLFIEEPLRARAPAAWDALRQRLSAPGDPAEGALPPLIADESVQSARDIVRLAPSADGANVKLAKAGGLAPAQRWIHVARTLGLKVLLGCMIESSLAITAAAHLAPLADFADLDGALSLSKDPFEGARLEASGTIRLPARDGLGVVRAL